MGFGEPQTRRLLHINNDGNKNLNATSPIPDFSRMPKC